MDGDCKTDGTLTVIGGIVEVSENVFCINGAYRSLPGLRFPCRCTIIRLPENKLVVYSPFCPSLADVSSLGTVEAIIVPNLMHWTYAHAMKGKYPNATVYSSPGVKARFPDRDWGTIIEDEKPVSLSPDVEIFCISRLKPFQDILLLYRPSKTLLVCDIAFNLTDEVLKVASPIARWYVWLVNCKRKLGNGRILEAMVRPHCKDALPQVEKLMKMDWDVVIPCHGELVKSGAKQAFRENMYQFVKDSAEKKPLSWTTTAIGVAVLAVAIGVFFYGFTNDSQ